MRLRETRVDFFYTLSITFSVDWNVHYHYIIINNTLLAQKRALSECDTTQIKSRVCYSTAENREICLRIFLFFVCFFDFRLRPICVGHSTFD